MRENRGITLVALSVTIIIMLIITGIVIRMGLRDDGIVDETKKLTSNAESSNLIESIKMAILAEKNKNGSNNVRREKIESYIKQNVPDVYQWKDEEETSKIKGIILKNGNTLSIEDIARDMNCNISIRTEE